MSVHHAEHPVPNPVIGESLVSRVWHAILDDFTELLILNLTIWAAWFSAVWSFTAMTPKSIPSMPIYAIVFGIPALWASGETLKVAMAPPPDTVSHVHGDEIE